MSFSTKMVMQTGKSYYKSKIMAISYETISDCLKKEELEDLIVIEKDTENNVSYVTSNTYKINSVAIEISKSFIQKISKKFENGVPIPLGAFTGIKLISGIGKKINVKLVVISSVKCEFVSEFKEMGINQTRHMLKINVVTFAEIVCQHKTESVKSEISVILFDNLIVGKVPSTYLSGKILGDATVKNN